ncbi:hypothetical protein H1R20_g10898, partial [Candolleomyces eurysporus]
MITINGRTKRTKFLITGLGEEQIILGLPWLRKENPIIDWEKKTLTWKKTPITFPLKHSNSIPIRTKITTSQTLAQEHEEKKKEIPLEEQIPKRYHEYLDLFDKKTATRFPASRPYDHKIDLKPEFIPKIGKTYSLSPKETDELDSFLKENLEKGYIEPSQSPQAAPFFFVAKKDGSLRPCQDYRYVNEFTIRNAYPLPLISDLMDKLKNAKYFTKMDVRWGYNNVRIRESDKWKAAFVTNRGLFQPTVMFFGLCNSPATFQSMMDSIFEEEIRKGLIVVYMDDILIFADTLEELRSLTLHVLQKLRSNDLFLKPEKCTFETQKIDFLGMIVEPGKLTMDPTKLKGIQEWPVPTTVKQVRSFLGFGNFYRKFIRHYSDLAGPLNNLLKKNQAFSWTPEAQEAFDTLKFRFTQEPVLKMPDQSRPFFIEADASKHATGAVLMQEDSNGDKHPVAFLSKTFAPAEKNYQIYDRELLAIIRALRTWRHYLHGSQHPVTIITDHQNLTFFRQPQRLNQRQRRWIPELEEYNYVLEHHKGPTMVQSDTLSQRPDHHPEEDENEETILLPPNLFINALKLDQEQRMFDDSLQSTITSIDKLDHEAQEALTKLSNVDTSDPDWTLYPTKHGIILLFQNRIYLPDNLHLRRQVTKLYHDTPTAGHPGQQGTLLALQNDYFWPGMTKFVNNYVKGCAQCQQNKINRRPSKPPLFPIEHSTETRPFSQISMDLITDLPTSNGFDSILVIVDHGLTKGVVFTPCNKTITNEQVSDILFRKILTKYGRPNKIISDRGPQFVAEVFTTALNLMGIKSAPSTAFHPQTDGATERVNQEISAYLSIFCSVNPETWYDKLPLAEFTHNSRNHADRKHTPFELLYGYRPPAIPTAIGETKFPAVESRMKMLESARNEAIAAHELARIRMRSRFSRTFEPFTKGQKVWLDSRNLKLPYLSKKIAPKREGPFKILEVLSPVTYRLELPTQWKVHPVFHATLISPVKETDAHGPLHPSHVPEIVEGYEEFEVEGILKHKDEKGKRFYLVRWTDQPTTADSWEPEENITHAQETLDAYWKRVDEKNKKKAQKGKQKGRN